MAQVPIIMPQLGESIAEATVIHLLVNVGEEVNADQDVIEVETNKAIMNVTSPCSGRVEKWLVKLNESYPVGAVLGYLEASVDVAARLGPGSPAQAGQKTWSGADNGGRTSPEGRREKVEPTVRGLPVPAHAAGASYMSPRMKARMGGLGLHAADLAGVARSGPAGRRGNPDFRNLLAHP